MAINTDFLSIPLEFRPSYTSESPIKIEKSIAVLNRNSSENQNVSVYQNFDSELSSYISKIPSEVVRSIIIDLLNKKMIFCGILPVHQSGILGTILFNSSSNELIGIVVEMNNLEIEVFDGTITRTGDVVYSIYQQYIRAVVINKVDLIKKNVDLMNLIEKYFNFLIIKILKLTYLTEKQRIMFNIVTSAFFYRFYNNVNYNLSVENAFTKYCPKTLYDELSEVITAEKMKRYSKFNDLFNAYFDFKVLLDDPNTNIRKFLVGLKLYGYLFVSFSLDYLISTICSSKYNFSVIIPCFVDSKIQSHIEDIVITKYSNDLKYDSMAAKYLK